MKDVVLMLSGFVRGPNNFCLNTLSQYILKPFNAKVYAQIYDCENLNEFVEKYNPSRVLLTHKDEPIISKSPEKIFPETNIQSTLYMWRNIKRVFDIVPKSSNAVFIRSRYDLCYDNSFIKLISKSMNANKNTIIVPKGGDARGGLFDMIAAGDYESMMIYSNLYKYVDEYITLGIPFHPEIFLRHHLEKNNISIERIDIPIGLTRASDPSTIFRGNVTIPGEPQILYRI